MSQTPTQIAPPPWELEGNGYIFLFHFPKAFVEEQGFLDAYQHETFKSSLLGTVMLVDYSKSAVGPYKELLFVPGRFSFEDTPGITWGVSKIYVSSYDSVWNGRENWGIPKELADFKIHEINKSEEIIEIKIGSEVFFKVHLKKRKFTFPVSTRFFPLRLAQKLRGDLIITNSTANGRASFAKLLDIQINSQYFPDVSKAKLLAILAVKDFKMTFPIPKVLKDYFIIR